MAIPIKGVVFGMDSVLRAGAKAVPGAGEQIDKLKKANMPVAICTNECRFDQDEIRRDLLLMGIKLDPHWPIYTSAMAARDTLRTLAKQFKSGETMYVGVIGEKGLLSTLLELQDTEENVRLQTVPPMRSKGGRLILVVGAVTNFLGPDKLNLGLRWLQAGAQVLATCLDATDTLSKENFRLCTPTRVLGALAQNTVVPPPYSVGKPHVEFSRYISSYFMLHHLQPCEILFVGDSYHTDIRLAFEAGYQSCLVLADNSIKDTTSIFLPNFVIDSIAQLFSIQMGK